MREIAAGQQRAMPPTMPRLLCVANAAAYVGVSVHLFKAMLKDGRLPPATRIGRRCMWDRAAIDHALDRVSGLAPEDQAGARTAAILARLRRAD